MPTPDYPALAALKSDAVNDASASLVKPSGPRAEQRPSSGGSASRPLTGEVAVMLLADVSPKHRLWGYGRFVWQRLLMRGTPGLVLCKVMGSGFDGGFGLKPSGSRQALFCVFSDEASADAFLASAVPRQYADRAHEFCSAKLRAYSCKGTWSGVSMAITAEAPASGPIVSLTRASIRPSRARQFWKMQPPSEVALAQAAGCLLATGVGEAPVLRQATFTLWSGVAAMDAYARSGAHLAAIRAAYGGEFFSESMFVRFVPTELRGNWRGRHYG